MQDSPSLIQRAANTIGRMLCALRGHDSVLHYEDKRMMMRCTSCGYDSPGWEVTGREPRKRFAGDDKRHAMHRCVSQ